MNRFTTAAAALTMASALSMVGITTASATTTVTAKPSAAATYEYLGPIRPVGNGHWCLTMTAPKAGAPFAVLPCVKSAADQTFYAVKISNGGPNSIGTGNVARAGNPSLQLGQTGKSMNAVVVDNIGGKHEFIITFIDENNGWVMQFYTPAAGKRNLTVPSHLRVKKPPIVQWAVVAKGKAEVTQEWLLGKWVPVEPIVA